MFNSDLLKNGLLGELGGMFKRPPEAVSEERNLLPGLGGVVGAFAANFLGSADAKASSHASGSSINDDGLSPSFDTYHAAHYFWDDD